MKLTKNIKKRIDNYFDNISSQDLYDLYNKLKTINYVRKENESKKIIR
jgi:DNA-binding protein Fis